MGLERTVLFNEKTNEEKEIITIAWTDIEVDHVLKLLDIYMAEWRHRDEILWKQVYKYFYATVLVLFIPNLSASAIFKFELPFVPSLIFPCIAAVMSCFFYYVSLGYTKRLSAIGDTCQRLINYLPDTPLNLRRKSLDENDYNEAILNKEILNKRMSVMMCRIMFVSLLLMSITMISYYIYKILSV